MADCMPDYPVLGMQAGEELATMLRLVALVISISVLFPWLSSERRGRMRIFFLHWASGVMYVMSQFIMSVMVLNCWSSRDDSGPFIYFLKFLELTALNLWSISSLAIAILIASIVQSFVKLRRVPTMIGSTRAACVCLVLAILATVLSAVFWNGVLITGGYFWVTNTGNESHGRWISLSFGATQTVAGMLMALAVLFTVSGERFSSLKVCCKTSQRVKFHFILTIFGTFVYLYNGIVLMFDEFSDFKISKRLVIIGWCSRYVHVIADTGIIFGAFYALEKKEEEESLLRRESNSGGTGDCNGTSASKARLGVLRFGNDDNNISGNLEAGLGRGPTECMGGGGEVCPNGSRKNGSSKRSKSGKSKGSEKPPPDPSSSSSSSSSRSSSISNSGRGSTSRKSTSKATTIMPTDTSLVEQEQGVHASPRTELS